MDKGGAKAERGYTGPTRGADVTYPTIWRPSWNFAEIFGVRKLESLGYQTALFA